MFKDFRKYLSTSLKVYLFILIIIFIMKVVGLDYFGLDADNKIIKYLANLVQHNLIINNIIFFGLLWFNQYILLSISANDNSKRMLIYNLIILPIFYVFEGSRNQIFGNFSFIAEAIVSFIFLIIYEKKVNKAIIKRYCIVLFSLWIIQIISIFTRVNYSLEYVSNPIINIILNLDYVIMLIIIYKLNFTKGDGKLCGCQVDQCSSLQMKSRFINLQKEFQKNYSNFKKLDKQEKATIIIYSIFSLLWNIFTLLVVLFIAKLNDTFIECIFIISSFWLSKKVFGKPFHLKSMIQCFILSNATYYILNRITTPTGISILIPIMLGVGLSYITSKLVKKRYKPLYKGMSKDDFEETILKVADKDSLKYQICYDYFINKENAVYLGHKYNYSEAGIRKITSRINDDIKALN